VESQDNRETGNLRKKNRPGYLRKLSPLLYHYIGMLARAVNVLMQKLSSYPIWTTNFTLYVDFHSSYYNFIRKEIWRVLWEVFGDRGAEKTDEYRRLHKENFHIFFFT